MSDHSLEFATINPSVLTWALGEGGFSIEEAARRSDLERDRLRAASAETGVLTIEEVARLARVLHRPLDIFWLTDAPAPLTLPKDHRSGPNALAPLSPEARLSWRRAIVLRATALELYAELGRPLSALTLTAAENEPADQCANRIAGWLGLDLGAASTPIVDAVGMFLDCVRLVEGHGVIVLESLSIEIVEATSLTFGASELPLIILNGRSSFSTRLVALLHSLVHLLFRQSAICDLALDVAQSSAHVRSDRTERCCTQIVNELLRCTCFAFSEHDSLMTKDLFPALMEHSTIELEVPASIIRQVLKRNGSIFCKLVLAALAAGNITEICASRYLELHPSLLGDLYGLVALQ